MKKSLSRELVIASQQINQYIIVAYETHKLGCIECVRNRLEDKSLIQEVYRLEADTFDFKIIEELKEEVLKEDGHYYYVYNLLTKESSKLLMIKYPQCPGCSEIESIQLLKESAIIPKDDRINHGYRQRSFSQTIELFQKNMDSFLHPVFGLFDTHSRNISDCMPLISLFVSIGRRRFDAHGRRETYKGAFFTAILEGLERFHGIVPSSSTCLHMSELELVKKKEDYVSLWKFNHLPDTLFDHENILVEKYSENTKIFWRYAYSLNKNKYVLVPEEIIFFSTHDFYKEPNNKRYILDSSNGVALGSNLMEASIGGLFEVIERDSFLVHWYSKSRPIRVEGITTLGNKNINMIIAYLETLGYQVHIFDITLESEVPTFWVLLEYNGVINHDDVIAFYTSAGTDINPEAAIESALVEASTSIRSFVGYQKLLYKDKNVKPEDYINDYKKIKMLEDHLYLYSSTKMRFAFEFALHTDRVIEAKELIKRRSTYLNKYSTQGDLFNAIINKLICHHDIYQANLSSRTLKNFGFNCVKILIPTMQNIGFGYLYQNINVERIKQAVQLNGLDGRTEVMNDDPHPFP